MSPLQVAVMRAKMKYTPAVKTISIAPKVVAPRAALVFELMIGRLTGSPPSVLEIQEAVADYYGVSRVMMVSKNRHREIIGPRYVAIYLARKLTVETTTVVGRLFGGRDHSTIVHAMKEINRRIGASSKLASEVAEIEAVFGGPE